MINFSINVVALLSAGHHKLTSLLGAVTFVKEENQVGYFPQFSCLTCSTQQETLNINLHCIWMDSERKMQVAAHMTITGCKPAYLPQSSIPQIFSSAD